MKKNVLALFVCLFSVLNLFAQSDSEGALEHIHFFSDREQQLSKDYLSYMSAVAHSGRARKMEKRRLGLIATIKQAISDGNKLRPYKGDASLKNAYLEYWNILYSVFNDDYHKIVDMEELAERSYDLMETYILAQEKVDEKVDAAQDKLHEVYHAFAAGHNITITETDSNLSKKVKQASRVNQYTNMMFLVYFKAAVQEVYLMDAINGKDLNAVEQSRGSLIKYADEGMTKLDTIKAFDDDKSVILATRKVFEFYKKEANVEMPVISEYFIKLDEFNKIKKSFDAKPADKRTQADVDAFNKSVNEINAQVASYNKANDSANKGRTDVMNKFEQTKKDFMDKHVPYK
jgi:hypothetical protein